jgi:hypothetical protein
VADAMAACKRLARIADRGAVSLWYPSAGGLPMNKVVIDAAMRANLSAPAELTDESGQTIGFVISPQQFERIQQLEEDRKSLYRIANSLVTDEELDAADAEGGDHTPEEVREHLRQLEAAERAKSA